MKALLMALLMVFSSTAFATMVEAGGLNTFHEGQIGVAVVEIRFIYNAREPLIDANHISVVSGTAKAGQDYNVTGAGVVHNIATGKGVALIELEIIDDDVAEIPETFTVTLDMGEDQLTGQIRIMDNDGI
jgi:hypothetical protein